MTAPSLAGLVRWVYATHNDLLDPRLTSAYVSKLTRDYVRTTVALVVGTALTFFADFRLGMAIIALVALSYLLPPLAPEFRPGQEPKHELDEADEQTTRSGD